MDYKEKYEQALEKARQLCAYPTTQPFVSDLQDLFPELKESEDEKIRQKIIEDIKGDMVVGGTKDKEAAIAWLEKQGEKMADPRYSILNKLIEADDIYQMSINDAMVEEAKNKAIEALSKLEISKLLGLEKQGEQKSADKTKPKFHEGDWIVSPNGVYWHIDKISNNRYEVTSNTGESSDCWNLDTNIYHKFTIQDAKDGDVLSDGTTIFIFKDLLSDGSVMSHCDYDADSGESDVFCPLSMNLMCLKITPATKEQRDQLEKAMADAGYTFDLEKKELKKIEQKHAEWSEEDEKMFRDLHNLIYVVRDCDCDSKEKLKLSDWIESLKGRYQSKQEREWSKEDEKCIGLSTDIIDSALRAGFCVKLDRDRCVDWLKSLRPQSHWKPSDEQMEALEHFIVHHNGSTNYAKDLEELRLQLKKLRED